MDLYGHIAYLALISGHFLISRQNKVGWILRFIGEAAWGIIGWQMHMSSIWSWSILFGLLDIYGFYNWSKNAKEKEDHC